jgi:hypothetical protein
VDAYYWADDSDREDCWISRSLLDDGVWVPHIPNTDIATSENHAGSRLWQVKQYVETKAQGPGHWVRTNADNWVYVEDE